MSNLNTSNKISLVNANNFTTSKDSRRTLMSKLNDKEKLMFSNFVKSVGVK